MARIISDVYVKEGKQIWGDDPHTAFNKKILAVNAMYGWMYSAGILKDQALILKDYSDRAYFAIDTKALEPYREQMLASGTVDAALAVQHIFDEPYTPCMYSGAIELGWTMSTYREVDGCVGRSWECGLVQNLNTEGIYKVLQAKERSGVAGAIQELYSLFAWPEPSLAERLLSANNNKQPLNKPGGHGTRGYER